MKLIKRVVLWGMMLMLVMAAVPSTALAASETEINVPVTGRIGNPGGTGGDTEPPEEPQQDTPSAEKKSSSTASGVKTGDWTEYSSYLILLGGAIILIIVYMYRKKKSTRIIHYK
ncbi:MAG: hypothetical protein ACRC3H_00735 [Lachnospiraceae bacterium]